MCILAILKLRDLEGFSNMFLGYHLLAQRLVRYAYVYPFAEALAGILMIAGALMWIRHSCGPIYRWNRSRLSFQGRLHRQTRTQMRMCAGGDSNVPLGFVSLTENLMMVGMAIWMMLK